MYQVHVPKGGPPAEAAYVRETYRALTDAILPPTNRHAGAVQLGVDRFVAEELDHSQFIPAGTDPQRAPPLSWSTAFVLDKGAEELVGRGLAIRPVYSRSFPGGGLFSALTRINRLRALALIDRLEIPLHRLPQPYTNQPGMVQTIVDSLHQLTMFGYYSEWFGYGTTRFASPDRRRLEFRPPVWQRIGYPGPAFGYRDLRGFLLTDPHPKGG